MNNTPNVLTRIQLCLCASLCLIGWAQAQEVPKELMLGDLKLTITESTRQQIQKDVDRLTRSPTYFNILVDRMNLYFPIIEREHAAAGVPDEIKFLAIQESALISDAVSSANAVGFWQFKDFTAREVGLTVDRKVDERLNIVAASKGSAKYMNTNQFFLKNWVYSVMAYNTGRFGAEKYIDTSKYGANKMTINQKTHWYVKKFIAHVVAFSPEIGKPHSEELWLDEITNAGGKTLQAIAKEQKVELEELKSYNKWLKSGSVPTDKTYTVLVPKKGTPPKRLIAGNRRKTGKIFTPTEKKYPAEIKPGITAKDRHSVIPINGIPSVLSKATDDVHAISARAGISEKKFRKYNDMGYGDSLIANEFYYIKKKKNRSKVGLHIARAGETLWDIAQKYGIKKAKLAKMNRMSIIDDLDEGRILWLNKTRPANEPIAYHQESKATSEKTVNTGTSSTVSKQTASAPQNVPDIEVVEVDMKGERLKKVKIHTVAKGESLWAISRLYEVSVQDLLRWNELSDPNAISIGQNIQVKAPIEEVSKDKEMDIHTVGPGETLYAISRKYQMTVDELMELNNLRSTDLNVGEKLKVFSSQ